jgi:Putative Ig domain
MDAKRRPVGDGPRMRSRILLVLSVSAVVAGVACDVASAVPVFAPATIRTGLPANAYAGTNGSGSLNAIACTSPGNCVGAGAYQDNTAGYDVQAMAATESGGAWAPATEITLPNGADSAQYATLYGIACASPGNCVASGGYKNATTGYEPMIVVQAGGTWSQATGIALPPNAQANQGASGLNAISCTSAGNCATIGYYTDTTNSYVPMVVTETNGTWGAAQEVGLPPGAVSGGLRGDLNGIACASAGNCVAVGGYSDSSSSGEAMAATETNGTWAAATEMILPPGAAAGASGDLANLHSVACPSPGNCVATGYYTPPTGGQHAMVETETGGTWGQGAAVSLPQGALASGATALSDLNTVVCTAAASCVAVGYYRDTNGTGDTQAMAVTETGGTWAQAGKIPLPAGAATAASGQDAQLNAVACAAADRCTAAGHYTDGSGTEHGMTVASVPVLAVDTTALPGAAAGVHYSAQLSASGGTGSVTWSLSAGALPSGLTLNAATGAISGTAISGRSASFTVHAADAGPPAQSGTAALSIAVAPPPTLGTLKAKVSGSKVTVTISCNGLVTQSCTGAIKLASVEHFKGPKLTGVTAAKSRRRVRSVTFARSSYTIHGRHTATIVLRLSRTGKKLLATRHKLLADLTLTPTGQRKPAKRATVTFHAGKKKR